MNSIHDLKWISWFSEQPQYKCHVISRQQHEPKHVPDHIHFIGTIKDYSVFKPWTNKADKKRIHHILNTHQINLVHIFYAEPNLLWLNAIPSTTPALLTTRGSDVLVGLKHFINRKSWQNNLIVRAYQNALLKCSAISSTSIKQAQYLTEHFKLNTVPEIIRTGINTEAIQAKKPEGNIIFFPRNMTPLYHHELALAAIAKLPEHYLQEYQFLFVNKNSQNQDYVRRIEAQMAAINTDNITFKDSLSAPEYFAILAQSKLVVMTPNSDGAPVSGMEAIAAGAKLVLPKIGYDEDLYRYASYYTPNNIEDLTKTIIKSLSDQASMQDLKAYRRTVDRQEEMKKIAVIYKAIQ